MLKIAINGYGRIGRNVLRAWVERGCPQDLQFVAINDLGDAHTLMHLTRYDSTHGRFTGHADLEAQALVITEPIHQQKYVIPLLQESMPEQLPWQTLEAMWFWNVQASLEPRRKRHVICKQGQKKSLLVLHRLMKSMQPLFTVLIINN